MKRIIALILMSIIGCSTISTASAKEDWDFVVETCRKGAKTFDVTCKTVDPDLRKKYQTSSLLQGFPDEYMCLVVDESFSGESGLVIHTDDGTYEIYFPEALMSIIFVWGIANSMEENNRDPYEYDFILSAGEEQRATNLGAVCEVVTPILEEAGMELK